MKMTTRVLAMSFCLALASCGGTVTLPDPNSPLPAPAPGSAPDITGYIAQLETGVQTFCGYQLLGNTAASLLSAFGVPVVGMVPSLVKQVCDTLGRSGASRSGSAARVVVVRGKRVLVQARRVR